MYDKLRVSKTILSLLVVLITTVCFAQTVELADTNFRNKLKANYPQVIQDDQLLISAANSLEGLLNLRNAKITNLSGIEHFTSITTLDITDNKLTTIPDISTITGLVNFYGNNNQFISLPDFTNQTELVDFQVMNNQLIALPGFSESSQLKSLYCTNNNITQLPPFTQFPNLEILVIGENQIAHELDFSSLTKLIQLHVHKLNLSTIVGLENLMQLQILFAWGNNISNFRGLDSNTTLTRAFLYENPMNQLPFLGNKPNLNTLDIHRCQLTFEDIVPLIEEGAPTFFTYSPQKPFTINNISAREESNLQLEYPITSPSSDNIYVWKKDNVTQDSSYTPFYILNPLKAEDAGVYSLKIYNSTASSLTLYSTTFQVTVLPCIEFNLPVLDIVKKDCVKGYTIDLSNAEILGENKPFTFQLNDGMTTKTWKDYQLDHVKAGKYELTVIDAKNCTATQPIALAKIKGCDPVLTPNGDGIADYYYIEHAGKVNIYDYNRTLVNTLQAPINWDGTNRDGNPLDAGYYIVIPEGAAPIYVTLIR